MSQSFQYRSALRAADAWTEVFNTDEVRKGTISLTTLAEHLQVGQSTIILDDPDGDVGHDGDTILGLHRFELIEDDAVDDEHVVIAFIGQRKFRRGDSDRPSLRTGAQRQIELSLADLNCIPSFRVIDPDDEDAERPAETVDDRLAWILGSDYLLNAVHDDGVVESNTTMMDAAKYGGQTAANVISDCELAAGFGWNAWVYYLEDAGHYSLGFINANTSTLYSSAIKISNLLADADTTTVESFETGTTFLPLYDSELTKDPSNLVSGVYVPYADSVVFRERQTTEDIYGPREQSAPNTNVKTASRAAAMAEGFLDQHATDADNIHVAIEVPTSKANAIKAGQRLEVKFSHLPGYEDWTWCRVIRRTIIQEQATDRYIIDMDLSPQEEAPPAGAIVQTAVTATAPGGGVSSFPSPVTIGNLLVFMGCKRGSDELGPDAPNTTIDHERWGAGAWTDATPNSGSVKVEWDDPRAYRRGMRLYWKVADSTEQDCYVDEYTVSACWEIAGSTMTGATIVYQTLQAMSNTHAIGSLGTPSAGQVALLMLGLGAGAASPVPVNVSLNVGSWVRDIHADTFAHVWPSETNSVGFNMPAPPEAWIGHQITDGNALAATVTDAYTHKWGGIALVLPPV